MERIGEVFAAMGYEIGDGPEVEAEWLNFDALNMPPDHPARTMQDTFFVESADSGHGAAHPDLARADPHDAHPRSRRSTWSAPAGSSAPTSSTPPTPRSSRQVEGLVVDEGVTMADLKGTLDHFAASMFGQGIVTRLRPSYFPFTEPSAEVDLQCFVCRGSSVGDPDHPCRTCSSEGWIEWGGCGVVNPRVLIACGIDPERYSGFAFGMGIERTLMFRHDVRDMRDMVEGDIRFTQAFGMEV